MKYVKLLGLAATAAAVLMVFAASASATIVTSNGVAYTGKLEGANEKGHASLHGSNGVTIECEGSLGGTIESHGAAVTAEGKGELKFAACTNGYVVHVKKSGTVIAHASAGNATITSSGAEVEVTAKSIFGTITCIFTTNSTHLGLMTSSKTTGGQATMDLAGTIPRTGGSSLCGSSGTLTGNGVVASPLNLNVD